MSERHDSKQAEKTYLGRTGGSAWERLKPFSPPGDDTLTDSLELLHDFATAVRILEPEPGDLIADLGAGGGWCSDLLQRLNRRSIAIDISVEMLTVARQRPTASPIRAVAGDFERLPFADASFDKAICLNALHHVPDMALGVREISRILTPRGVAVFSEPGTGHAKMPASIAATRDFGVLEQEVLIEPFIEMCRAAGFVDVRVCPIAYVVPEFELSMEEWRAWKRLPRVKRPLRAAEKMWRAALEFVGAGKRSVLFEEAFAMRLVRLLQQPIEEHPFFLAAKYERPNDRRPTYRAAIHPGPVPAVVRAGEPVEVSVTIENRGRTAWPATSATGSGNIRLGIQLLDPDGLVIARDFARADLTRDVPASESLTLRAAFNAPDTRGAYQLKFDMVVEGVTWFEPTGSPIEVRPLVVRGN
ncbi:MAG TPA: class I SAM-dependent methyltransferase [Steroidobacteraceae bacterium]